MKILIADDSAIIVSILRHYFEKDSEFQIIGVARNGEDAIEMNKRLSPDGIIMDINMPVTDGLTATRRIREQSGTPVLIFSSDITPEISTEAKKAGATAVLPKPDLDTMNTPDFIEKIRAMLLDMNTSSGNNSDGDRHRENHRIDLVVVGTSTGGPKTIRSILAALPASLPVPMALVQHLEAGFEKGYAQWLNDATELEVLLVENPQTLERGKVYIAPSGFHMAVTDKGLELEDAPPIQNQKPAVDRLFSSAATVYGASLLGVLLTGMGRDGANGCVDIISRGGVTIVQDESTSDIFGMPRAAIEQHAATWVMPLNQIAQKIESLTETGRER